MCRVFDERFESIKHTMSYNPEWENSGYYNRLCTDSEICKLPEAFKTSDEQNRRIIVIPTPLGNAVVFERWPGDTVLTSSIPKAIADLASPFQVQGILDQTAVEFIIGSHRTPDIGKRLRSLVKG